MAFNYIISGRSKLGFLLLSFIICLCGSGVLTQIDPADVTDLQLVNVTENTIVVQWKDPQSIKEFNVSITNGSAPEEWRTVNGTIVTINNLLPGVNYTITVNSWNGTSGNPGASISVTTLPSVVKDVVISNISTHGLTISWTKSSDPNVDTYTYTVVWQGPGFNNHTNTTNNNIVVVNLEAGSDYYFTVYAVTNDGVNGSASDTANATTLPSVVNGLTVSDISSNAVNVSWTKSSDPNEDTYTYTVHGDGPGFEKQTGLKTNSMWVARLEAGSDYNITVYAVTNNGIYSLASDVANATTLPSVVKDVVISNISTQGLTISWTKSSDPNEDTYTYTVHGDGPGFEKQTGLTTNSTWVARLEAGSDYNITVYAVTNNGIYSLASDVANATTLPSIVPTFMVTSKTNQSVTLNWTFPNNTHVSTYTYTVQLIHDNFNQTVPNIEDDFLKMENLSAGETYKFTIYTVTINGIRSSEYPFITATTMPNEPQSLTGAATGTHEILINWAKPSDVHVNSYEYNVEWQNVKLNTDNGLRTIKETHLAIRNLFPGNLYKITVTSLFRETSSLDAVKIIQTNPVSTQNFSVPVTTTTSATLQWDVPSSKNSNVNGYRVLTILNKQAVYNQTTQLKYIVVESLIPGNIYEFSVESFASNTIALQKRSLGQMDSTWISYSTPQTAKGETVPDLVKNVSCSEVDGYHIRVNFDCPVGNYSEIQVLVNTKPNYNCSCTKSNVISGLQPANEYKVEIVTLGTDKSDTTPIIKCSTDYTGVIVGSVLGILIFLLLIGVIVFFVLKKRRSDKNLGHVAIASTGKRFHTISKGIFPKHYEKNHANSDFGFAEEYQELSSVGTGQSRRAAELQDNKIKNRFSNVLPYDHSRVKLSIIDDIPTTDYINANFMPGYNSTKEFIASQGPLPNTTADFWRMILEYHINTIVMLTNCMENGRVKCERYWPLDYTPCTYGDITVTVTSETILPEWTTRNFSVKHAQQPGVHFVHHFHFTAWPDHGVPDSTSSIAKFHKLVRDHVDQCKSNGPTVVHCSAGVGRTGTLIALDYLIQQMEREQRIGIYRCVEKMRMNRCYMVQTEDQYIFLNKCMLDFIEQSSEENIYENQNPTDLIYENASVVRNFQRENA